MLIPRIGGDPRTTWDRLARDWARYADKIAENWPRLTTADLARINGDRRELERLLAARYGKTETEIRKDVETWLLRS